MADNTNNPRGFRAASPIYGAHHHNGGTAAAIYPGDAVMVRADGKTVIATAGSTQIVGVAASYKSATYTTVIVYDDPDQTFFVQDDGGGTTSLAQSKVGLNGDHIATTGNATIIKSRHTFDRNPIAASTAGFRILAVPGNQGTGKYQEVRVGINEHFLKKATGVV